MLEKIIEKKFVSEVKKRGGIAIKFVSPTLNGMPDRLVLIDGKVGFVEVKALNQKPRPLQVTRHRLLKKLGFKVYVLDNINQIKTIIDEIENLNLKNDIGGDN
jgi:hypothetical protein